MPEHPFVRTPFVHPLRGPFGAESNVGSDSPTPAESVSNERKWGPGPDDVRIWSSDPDDIRIWST